MKAILVIDIDDDVRNYGVTVYHYPSRRFVCSMDANLKPLPQKIDILEQSEKDFDSYPDGEYLADKLVESQGYKRRGCCADVYHGWNACLDEITGETE